MVFIAKATLLASHGLDGYLYNYHNDREDFNPPYVPPNIQYPFLQNGNLFDRRGMRYLVRDSD